jgi:hypothetical protein
VHRSTLGFAMWLANAFEVLAGEDLTAHVVVSPGQDNDFESDEDEPRETPLSPSFDDNTLVRDHGDGKLLILLDKAREQLVDDSGVVASEVVLAITELSRQASESVPQSIQLSFKTHMGESAKKKSVELFPGESGVDACDEEQHEVNQRFQAAASLVFLRHIVYHAEKAVLIISQHTVEMASLAAGEVSNTPSEAIVKVLAMAKDLFLKVSEIFEQGKGGGPIAERKDNENIVARGAVTRKTGLYLDVERMFKEQVVVFPHPSDQLPLTSTAAVFYFLKIVIQSMIEYSKMNLFTSGGLEQATIDYLFLEQIIYHYVSDKEMIGGVSCSSVLRGQLSDFFEVAQERCSSGSHTTNLGHASEFVNVYLSGVLSGSHEDSNKIMLRLA